MGIKHKAVKAHGDKGLHSEWNDDHKIDGDVNFEKHESKNFVIDKGASFPAGPVAGQLFYRTDLNSIYFFDGIHWNEWILGSVKYEYYDADDDTEEKIYSDHTSAQQFTVGTVSSDERFIISYLRLRLRRLGIPGVITISLKAVDGAGKPTGAALSEGTISYYSITQDAAGEWYKINMTPYELQPATQYVIVAKANVGDIDNYLGWRIDSAGSTYAGGTWVDSDDDGVTWNVKPDGDFMFEVWGRAVCGATYAGLWETIDPNVQLKIAKPVNMQTKKIINVVDPAANQDAATKKYVDDQAFLQKSSSKTSVADFDVPNAWGDVTGMTDTFTPDKAGIAFIIFSAKGTFGPDQSVPDIEVRIDVDGTPIAASARRLRPEGYADHDGARIWFTSDYFFTIMTQAITTLTAASHTIKIQAQDSNTGTTLKVREMDILVF